MLRPMIHRDEEKCNGCGQCITDCAEGALAIIDGKAKLISETYCDGLGACLNCPQGALTLKMKEAPAFDEHAALAAKAAREKGCADGKTAQFKPLAPFIPTSGNNEILEADLSTWPIQLQLISPHTDWLKNAHLLLAAQCAGFSIKNLQKEWLPGKILMIACPKLEDNKKLLEKLTEIFRVANPASITILRMSVPCCGGLERLVKQALALSGKDIAVDTHIVQLPKG